VPLHIAIHAREKLLQTCQVAPEQPRTLDRKRLVEGPLTRLRPEETLAVARSPTTVLSHLPLMDQDSQITAEKLGLKYRSRI